MTVLILAPELDVTADGMVKVLEQRDAPVARVDTAWFPQRASIDAELRAGRWVGRVTAGGRRIALEGLRSIWYRSPSAFQFPARFASGGETVTKALGAPAITEDGGRKTTFTHLLEAADVADLRGIEVTTHQFQRWVPKSYEARVIVAGDRVFAAGIYAESNAAYLDWRNDYSALRYEKLEPPLGVAAGVLEYCVELGLTYGAFDFVIRRDGEWVFLECNPGGQYGWIEDAIAAPITETLADLLTEGVTT